LTPVYIDDYMGRQGKMPRSATGKINPALGFANHGADLAYRARFTINFLVFDVMLHANSSPRPEGPSPPLPRRSHSGLGTGPSLRYSSCLTVTLRIPQLQIPSNVAVAGTSVVVTLSLRHPFLAFAP
jgi:hypothetical protein